MNKNTVRVFQAFGYLFLLFLSACSPVIVTPSPGMLETLVAATVNALPTSTTMPTATETMEPTATKPTPTETLTQTPLPTIPPLPTSTPLPTNTTVPTATMAYTGPIIIKQGDANYACGVLGQDPSNYLQVRSGQDVLVVWSIRNLGERDWEKENIDIGYISGQKMAIGGTRFDLSQNILKGQTGEVTLKFEAPDKAGTYTTVWALFRGSNSFCEFTFSLVVK